MIALTIVHIALCGVAAGLSWRPGTKGLALALAGVLVASVGAFLAAHVAWHAVAPFACLAGVIWTCWRGRWDFVMHGGFFVAAVLALASPRQLATGWILAFCHATAFVLGLYVYRTRDHFDGPDGQTGIMVASCAAGTVGAALWAFGLTTTPATIVDVVLFVAYIMTAIRGNAP